MLNVLVSLLGQQRTDFDTGYSPAPRASWISGQGCSPPELAGEPLLSALPSNKAAPSLRGFLQCLQSQLGWSKRKSPARVMGRSCGEKGKARPLSYPPVAV